MGDIAVARSRQEVTPALAVATNKDRDPVLREAASLYVGEEHLTFQRKFHHVF
ncbi:MULTISPECIES: hypothetical protein [Corynebacterium]|uniref:hypothetical protein n=1 Tax=Corynebacterium TaxID=1716 RepID=UPI0012B5A787|nr:MULTISPECIES: hypothetical protein [Corynebacterium]MBF9011009.1 hypothetical protein [Corynebacterium phoceense]